MLRLALTQLLQSVVDQLVADGRLPSGLPRVAIEDPKDPSHGDFATNFAMVASKAAGMNPRGLAELIAGAVSNPLVTATEVAGPGFINLRLNPVAVARFVQPVLALGVAGFKNSAADATPEKHRVNVEFVSVNPNGPITIGSGRGAAFGSTLANVLEAAGHTVHREYYINDGVNSEQMRLFTQSLLAELGLQLGQEVRDETRYYKGETINSLAQQLLDQALLRLQESEDLGLDTYNEFRDRAQIHPSTDQIRQLAELGIDWKPFVEGPTDDATLFWRYRALVGSRARSLLSKTNELRRNTVLLNASRKHLHYLHRRWFDSNDGLHDAEQDILWAVAELLCSVFPDQAQHVWPDEEELLQRMAEAICIVSTVGPHHSFSNITFKQYRHILKVSREVLFSQRIEDLSHRPLAELESSFIAQLVATFAMKEGSKIEHMLNRSSYEQDSDALRLWVQGMMVHFQRKDLETFGTHFDTWFSEQSLHDSGIVENEIAALVAKGAADDRPIRHKLKLAKGGKIEDVEIEEQAVEEDGENDGSGSLVADDGPANPTVWLRSTKFGDDMDRVIRRKDGRLTYIASDVAYHKDKFNRPANADKLITILGPDHHGYIGRLHAVLAAIEAPALGMGKTEDWGEAPPVEAKLYSSPEERDACRAALDKARKELDVIIYQLVRFMKDGKPAPMRKRDGNIYAIIDLINEIGKKVKPDSDQVEQRKVGKDVARFFYLMRSHDTTFDFDLDLAEKQSDENPVFYVQYAHARICSVLRKAEEAGIVFDPKKTDTSLLVHPKETALVKKILDLPHEVSRAADDYGVHRLTTYAIELARAYHHFYDACRVVQPEQPELSQARLSICEATRIALQSTFELLGIEAPEQM